MKIAAIQISFPVLHIHSKVTYAVLRKPTLFERAILEVVGEFSGDERYGGYSLQRVFGEMLAVPEEDQFVLPSLRQLAEFGLIAVAVEFDSLQHVKLRDLTLTDAGRKMRERKAFPGLQRHRNLSYHYDPIQDRLLTAAEQELLSETPGDLSVAVEDEAAVGMQLVERVIRRRAAGAEPPPGEAPAAGEGDQYEIREIHIEGIQTLWQTREGELALAPDGELSIELGDPVYEDYFRHFSGRWLFENFLADFLTDVQLDTGFRQATPRPLREIADATEVFSARDIDLKMKLSSETTHFLRYQPYLDHHLVCKKKTLLVVFGYPHGEAPANILWDDELNGAVVFLAEPFPIPGCYYLNSERDNLSVDLFEVRINGDPYAIPLGYSLPKSDRRLNPAPLFKRLEPLIDKSGEVQYQLIKLFWRSPEEVWEIIKRLTS